MIDLARTKLSQHLIFLSSGIPSYLHDHDNPDWIPTQKLGYDQEASNSVGIQV